MNRFPVQRIVFDSVPGYTDHTLYAGDAVELAMRDGNTPHDTGRLLVFPCTYRVQEIQTGYMRVIRDEYLYQFFKNFVLVLTFQIYLDQGGRKNAAQYHHKLRLVRG